jgi:nucleotide-binding universal stress UspA family protein
MMTEAASKPECLLVMVDESHGTKRSVAYVARIIGRLRGFRVCLLHLLPPLPPELLEFGGAEDPRREKVLEGELRRDQQAWIASAKDSAKPALDDAIKVLCEAGLSDGDIHLACSDPLDGREVTSAVLDLARAKGCHTIVIGHESHFWFRQLTGDHLAEHLLHQSREITLWIVH